MPEIVAFNKKSAASAVPNETAKRFHDERNSDDCARANPEVGHFVPGLSVPGRDKDTPNSDVPQASSEKTLSVRPAEQEYVQMCLAEQAHTLSAMGVRRH